MKKRLGSELLLLLTAALWGTAFSAHRYGMSIMGPFYFNAARCLLAGVALLPVVFWMSCRNKGKGPNGYRRKDLIAGGLACGLALFGGETLQQVGIIYTTAGKTGFITALYIVIVPIMGIFLKRKTRPLTWICVVIAVAGLWLLSVQKGFVINRGDILVIGSAFFYALHILVIDHFTVKADAVKMSCIQFWVAGFLSLIPAAMAETFDMSKIVACWLPIVYSGVFNCAVAYTLQIIAQKNVEPAIASLLMSLESVFAVIAGYFILGEVLSVRESLGCVLMFAAVILAQLPAGTTLRKKTD